MSENMKKVIEAINEVIGTSHGYEQLSDDDLYSLENLFWGIHGDLVLEWSRRQMRAADPVDRTNERIER